MAAVTVTCPGCGRFVTLTSSYAVTATEERWSIRPHNIRAPQRGVPGVRCAQSGARYAVKEPGQ